MTQLFDATILHFLNAAAQHSWTLDTTIALLARAELLKGGLLAALFWWLWFAPGRRAMQSTRPWPPRWSRVWSRWP